MKTFVALFALLAVAVANPIPVVQIVVNIDAPTAGASPIASPAIVPIVSEEHEIIAPAPAIDAPNFVEQAADEVAFVDESINNPGALEPVVIPGPAVLPAPTMPGVNPAPAVLPSPAMPGVIPSPAVLPSPAMP